LLRRGLGATGYAIDRSGASSSSFGVILSPRGASEET
jgi:hypothetical protein